MIVEIISTGTELLLGEIVDLNAQYLSTRLNELGYDVYYRTTVGDNRQRMAEVLQIASQRADIVITSGGLGPTEGDITKEVTAEFCGRKMLLNEESLKKIKGYFAKRKMEMAPNNIKQAMFAEGAEVVGNNHGTAPGMLLEHNGCVFINLPGPPRELKGVFEDSVVPYLQKQYGDLGTIYSYTLRSIGLGESNIAEMLQDIIHAQTNPTIALYAREGEILIRITAKSASIEQARTLVLSMAEVIKNHLGHYVYGSSEQDLQVLVGNELLERKITIALAESCTGGMVSSMLVDVAGSSQYLLGSVVCYSNESKVRELQVCSKTLHKFGAVSKEVAVQMAEGVRNRMGSDIGVGITGVAGPGSSEQKQQGLVYIAISYKGDTKCRKYEFNGDRKLVRLRSSKTALANIWKAINSKDFK